MIALPLFYRFSAVNDLGQTIAANGIQVTGRRWKITSGAYDEETSEATLLDNAGTVADGVYEEGTKQSNDDAGTGWLGGSFVLKVIAPTSSSGTVTLYFDISTDDGTTWPNNGLGIQVAQIAFTTSGTRRVSFQL